MMYRSDVFKSMAAVAVLTAFAGCPGQVAPGGTLSPADLAQWAFYGIGEKSVSGEIFNFSESEGSKGVMIVSPEPVTEDVVVRCEMRANTADTVLVIALAFSDLGESAGLTVPAGYDGSIDWLFQTENYFFAFRNEPHKRKPFVRKNPSANKAEVLAELDHNVMNPGEWKSVEAGVKDGKAWLKIGGNLLFEVADPEPLQGGWVAFRIRGTATGVADCSIRNVSISRP